MKSFRWLTTLIMGAFLLGACDSLQAAVPEVDPVFALNGAGCHPLYAGQSIPVGTVCVAGPIVTFNTLDGWMLIESHLAVSNDEPGGGEWLANSWQNRTGSAVPGRFPYGMMHDPPVNEYPYVVAGIDAGETVYVAAHAVVQHVTESAPFGGSTVTASRQALRYDETAVLSQRSNPSAALTYTTGRDEANFFSLGFGKYVVSEGDVSNNVFFGALLNAGATVEGLFASLTDTERNFGWIIVEFDPPIDNAFGMSDLRVVEDTWGLPYPDERAAVFARNGVEDPWQYVCTAGNQDPLTDIHTVTECRLPEALAQVTHVLVQDVTDPADFASRFPGQRATLDGFDLNALQGLHGAVRQETAWGAQELGSILFVPRGSWSTYFVVP